MATGIRDKVAIIGMGCTRFGERWDAGAEELMVEAFEECLDDAGIQKQDIGAAWLGTCMEEINVGKTGMPLATTLRLPMIPVTRVENYCATGTEAFRGACYGVASGAYDICLALGVEKLKDTGYGGLPNPGSGHGSLSWQWWPNLTAPGSFAQLASAYAAKYKIPDEDLKRAMAHVSAKSHDNGLLNPKAHLRKKVTIDQVMASPIIAHPLGLFDCCGVSDGSACAIVTTPEIAKKLGKQDFVSVKALQLALSSGESRLQRLGRRPFYDHHKLQPQSLRRSRHQGPEERDQHDGGARLFLHYGVGHDGGSAYIRTGQGGPRYPGRLLRPGRHGAVPGGRRPQMLRTSHRGLRTADAL